MMHLISLYHFCLVTMSSSSEMRCVNCSNTIKRSQRFCESCGKKVACDTNGGLICSGRIDGNQCTNFLHSEMKYCPNCGTKTDSNILGNAHILIYFEDVFT